MQKIWNCSTNTYSILYSTKTKIGSLIIIKAKRQNKVSIFASQKFPKKQQDTISVNTLKIHKKDDIKMQCKTNVKFWVVHRDKVDK